eukprot:Awhi_evm1s2483
MTTNVNNQYLTLLSSGITTGQNSELPVCEANSIQGNFMLFNNYVDLLNLYQSLRRVGMLVKITNSIGPKGEPINSYYELLDGGELVGPQNILDLLQNETLSIYDKDVLGILPQDPTRVNSDDGTFWKLKEFCCNNSTPVEIKNYYHGTILGNDVKLTPTEIEQLEIGMDSYYVLYRIAGTLDSTLNIKISNFVFEDEPISFIDNKPLLQTDGNTNTPTT